MIEMEDISEEERDESESEENSEPAAVDIKPRLRVPKKENIDTTFSVGDKVMAKWKEDVRILYPARVMAIEERDGETQYVIRWLGYKQGRYKDQPNPAAWLWKHSKEAEDHNRMKDALLKQMVGPEGRTKKRSASATDAAAAALLLKLQQEPAAKKARRSSRSAGRPKTDPNAPNPYSRVYLPSKRRLLAVDPVELPRTRKARKAVPPPDEACDEAPQPQESDSNDHPTDETTVGVSQPGEEGVESQQRQIPVPPPGENNTNNGSSPPIDASPGAPQPGDEEIESQEGQLAVPPPVENSSQPVPSRHPSIRDSHTPSSADDAAGIAAPVIDREIGEAAQLEPPSDGSQEEPSRGEPTGTDDDAADTRDNDPCDPQGHDGSSDVPEGSEKGQDVGATGASGDKEHSVVTPARVKIRLSFKGGEGRIIHSNVTGATGDASQGDQQGSTIGHGGPLGTSPSHLDSSSDQPQERSSEIDRRIAKEQKKKEKMERKEKRKREKEERRMRERLEEDGQQPLGPAAIAGLLEALETLNPPHSAVIAAAAVPVDPVAAALAAASLSLPHRPIKREPIRMTNEDEPEILVVGERKVTWGTCDSTPPAQPRRQTVPGAPVPAAAPVAAPEMRTFPVLNRDWNFHLNLQVCLDRMGGPQFDQFKGELAEAIDGISTSRHVPPPGAMAGVMADEDLRRTQVQLRDFTSPSLDEELHKEARDWLRGLSEFKSAQIKNALYKRMREIMEAMGAEVPEELKKQIKKE